MRGDAASVGEVINVLGQTEFRLHVWLDQDGFYHAICGQIDGFNMSGGCTSPVDAVAIALTNRRNSTTHPAAEVDDFMDMIG